MFTWFTIQETVAGLWRLALDYGVMTILALALIAGSFFVDSVPFFGLKIAADMRWAGAFILGCLLWGAHIEHDTNLRWEAKIAVVNTAVDNAVTKAEKKPAPASRWETDQ